MGMALLGRVDRWLPPLALMAAIYVLSAQESLDSGLGLADLLGRKLIHFGEYALLCVLWWRLVALRAGAGRAALVAFLATAAYAASDEYHQTFVEGRTGSPLDWAIDAAGAGAAALVLRARRRVPA